MKNDLLRMYVYGKDIKKVQMHALSKNVWRDKFTNEKKEKEKEKQRERERERERKGEGVEGDDSMIVHNGAENGGPTKGKRISTNWPCDLNCSPFILFGREFIR